jgi:hypothetical protein
VRESRGNVCPGIGGRLVSQAGSPRGSSEATLVHVPIPCELSKVPVRPSNRENNGAPEIPGARKNSQSATTGAEGSRRFCAITWLAANPGRARVGGVSARSLSPYHVPIRILVRTPKQTLGGRFDFTKQRRVHSSTESCSDCCCCCRVPTGSYCRSGCRDTQPG